MEERTPVEKKKNSFFKRWFGFFLILIDFVIDLLRTFVVRYLAFFKKKPFTAIFVPVGLAFVALIVVGVAAYAVIDYTMFHPEFCVTCHGLMHESYDTWEKSSHAEVNCHTCHPLTPEYIQSVSISLVKGVIRGFPDKIPKRPPGKMIVRSQDCTQCHWDKGEEEKKKHGPEGAHSVASSQFHAVHYFKGQTECAACHGYENLHVFTTEPDDCLDCHVQHGDTGHAANVSDMACLHCHTDSTANLEPGREKCLSCHSEDDSVREALLQVGTFDVRRFQPSEEIMKLASKIEVSEKAAMHQFACQDCHKAHEEEDAAVRRYDSCLSCHPRIESMGQHELHMMLLDEPDCTQCHQPHSWSVTEEQVETACGMCHGEEIDPMTFISSGEI